MVLRNTFQRLGKKSVMRGNEGCDTCATCCHIKGVAAAPGTADWYAVTQEIGLLFGLVILPGSGWSRQF